MENRFPKWLTITFLVLLSYATLMWLSIVIQLIFKANSYSSIGLEPPPSAGYILTIFLFGVLISFGMIKLILMLKKTNKNMEKEGKVDYSTNSLVLGILSIILSEIGLFIVLGIFAIHYGRISIKNNYEGRGKAIAGLVTGIIGIILSVLMMIVWFFVLKSGVD